MNDDYKKNQAYLKLDKNQKLVVDTMIENLETNKKLWKRGWFSVGAPESINGKRYSGQNEVILTVVADNRGYSDNRWVTFNKIKEKGWQFKTDDSGNSLGKNAGVPVIYYREYDKMTKKPFDKSVCDGMTDEEKAQYLKDNVKLLKRTYVVFNGDVIDGIPQKEVLSTLDETSRNTRVERLLDRWNEDEAKIVYGGDRAYYTHENDEIHLPDRKQFYNYGELYGTALHELSHSTGHEKRLNRPAVVNNQGFATAEYAQEELRAEIAKMFLMQEYGVISSENHIQNNSAYIQSWLKALKDNPDNLFDAIQDANKICGFVTTKEKDFVKQEEPFAVLATRDDEGKTKFGVYMIGEKGGVKKALKDDFDDRETLLSEFEKVQDLPEHRGKLFVETDMDGLEKESEKRAEKAKVEEEPSEKYHEPSAKSKENVYEKVDMEAENKGRNSLNFGDREVLERAEQGTYGEKTTRLYNGESIYHNEIKDENALMLRLAVVCSSAEQIMRIFQSSGQFRESKPQQYYDNMCENCVKIVNEQRAQIVAANQTTKTNVRRNSSFSTR